MNLFIGIVGSYAGAIISSLLNIELFDKGYLTNFIFCVIGAIAVLWIWKKLSINIPSSRYKYCLKT